MVVVLASGLAFLCGAIPFSYILGRVFVRKDIRDFGDGNPGAANAWRAGGAVLGVVAILADFSKAFIPVMVAVHSFNLDGLALVSVAIAPVLGHAYSPFLGFRGGKAVASTYGIWLALTGFSSLLVMGSVSLIFHLLQMVDAWTVVSGLAALFVYLALKEGASPLLVICSLNLLIVMHKHAAELKNIMEIRPRYAAIFRRK